MKSICRNPEDCCRELTRVWEALGITECNGKSASENVAALVAGEQAERITALEAEIERLMDALRQATKDAEGFQKLYRELQVLYQRQVTVHESAQSGICYCRKNPCECEVTR